MKKILKIIGIILLVCVTALEHFLLFNFLSSDADPFIPKEATLIQDKDSLFSLNRFQKVVEVSNFPRFDTEIYAWRDSSGQEEMRVEVTFNPVLSEQEYSDLRLVCDSSCYWDSNKDGSMTFSRGWSKRDYMEVPEGMPEERYMEVHLNRYGMQVTLKNNPCLEMVDKDSLNRCLGVEMPDFTIVNYISPYRTTLRLNGSVGNLCVPSERYEFFSCAKEEGYPYYTIELPSVSLSINEQTHFVELDR